MIQYNKLKLLYDKLTSEEKKDRLHRELLDLHHRIEESEKEMQSSDKEIDYDFFEKELIDIKGLIRT